MILFNDNISKNIVGNPNEQASSIKFTEKESVIVAKIINIVLFLLKILLIFVIIFFLFSFFTT